MTNVQTERFTSDNYISQGVLGRHETFTPRYGWLKKGYDAVIQDGNIFKASDAIEKLGVGKNMVRSIRYWCQAFKIIKENSDRVMEQTELGDRLLCDNGWDPFLEDIASYWLLHWQLFTPPLEAVSWSFAFNKCNLWSFNIKQLSKIIHDNAKRYTSFASRSEKTFYRDASCIIRMYNELSFEDGGEIYCPFSQLGLVYEMDEDDEVRFGIGVKRSLPPLIFAAVCFSYIKHYSSTESKAISLYRLTHDMNSPGVVFKLPESAVGEYIYRAQDELDGFSLVDILGSQQLHLDEDPSELYWRTLEKYYTRR